MKTIDDYIEELLENEEANKDKLKMAGYYDPSYAEEYPPTIIIK